MKNENEKSDFLFVIFFKSFVYKIKMHIFYFVNKWTSFFVIMLELLQNDYPN